MKLFFENSLFYFKTTILKIFHRNLFNQQILLLNNQPKFNKNESIHVLLNQHKDLNEKALKVPKYNFIERMKYKHLVLNNRQDIILNYDVSSHRITHSNLYSFLLNNKDRKLFVTICFKILLKEQNNKNILLMMSALNFLMKSNIRKGKCNIFLYYLIEFIYKERINKLLNATLKQIKILDVYQLISFINVCQCVCKDLENNLEIINFIKIQSYKFINEMTLNESLYVLIILVSLNKSNYLNEFNKRILYLMQNTEINTDVEKDILTNQLCLIIILLKILRKNQLYIKYTEQLENLKRNSKLNEKSSYLELLNWLNGNNEYNNNLIVIFDQFTLNTNIIFLLELYLFIKKNDKEISEVDLRYFENNIIIHINRICKEYNINKNNNKENHIRNIFLLLNRISKNKEKLSKEFIDDIIDLRINHVNKFFQNKEIKNLNHLIKLKK